MSGFNGNPGTTSAVPNSGHGGGGGGGGGATDSVQGNGGAGAPIGLEAQRLALAGRVLALAEQAMELLRGI